MISADIMTAIVTPFGEDGNINFEGLEKLTNHLIETGSRGFVIGGTTGETPTLSHDEKIELYTRFAQIVDGRGTIIAGTGSNNTAETVQLTAEVGSIPGIDYALVVVPYYNKPNQRGMIAHYTAVAEQSPIPLIIYNIPGRTGVTMANDTVVELSHNENIAGVKQCTSLEDLEYLVQNTPDDFNVYTGEDAQALSAKAVGANGVISVTSHIYGREMRKMYDALESGDVETAGDLMRFLTPKVQALFMYPSPSCIKAILNVQGFGAGDCRLPIVSLNDEEKATLAAKLGVKSLEDIPVDGTEMAQS